MSLKQLVTLLKLMVFLVRKMVIIMLTLITNNLLKLVIMLSKLNITIMLSMKQIMDKPYHIYMRNLWKLQREINSKHKLINSLSQMQFKLLDGMPNTLSTPLLKEVTCSMSQKVWNTIYKLKDSTSTSKKNPPWWICKNSSKSLNFLKNGKVWSLKELRRNYLRPMFDLWISKN